MFKETLPLDAQAAILNALARIDPDSDQVVSIVKEVEARSSNPSLRNLATKVLEDTLPEVKRGNSAVRP